MSIQDKTEIRTTSKFKITPTETTRKSTEIREITVLRGERALIKSSKAITCTNNIEISNAVTGDNSTINVEESEQRKYHCGLSCCRARRTEFGR